MATFQRDSYRFLQNCNPKMVARNKLDLLSYKQYVEEYANEFQYLFSCISKFPISNVDKVERFFARLKEVVRIKVSMELKGDGGLWEDIKRLIHYAVIIYATYAQAANGERTSRLDPTRCIQLDMSEVRHMHR